MGTICGADCCKCGFQENCKGCAQTGGRPFGGECVAAECYKAGGEACFLAGKKKLMVEFNALGISDMPEVAELCPLSGAYINLEYTLPNSEKVRLLDDKRCISAISWKYRTVTDATALQRTERICWYAGTAATAPILKSSYTKNGRKGMTDGDY